GDEVRKSGVAVLRAPRHRLEAVSAEEWREVRGTREFVAAAYVAGDPVCHDVASSPSNVPGCNGYPYRRARSAISPSSCPPSPSTTRFMNEKSATCSAMSQMPASLNPAPRNAST